MLHNAYQRDDSLNIYNDVSLTTSNVWNITTPIPGEGVSPRHPRVMVDVHRRERVVPRFGGASFRVWSELRSRFDQPRFGGELIGQRMRWHGYMPRVPYRSIGVVARWVGFVTVHGLPPTRATCKRARKRCGKFLTVTLSQGEQRLNFNSSSYTFDMYNLPVHLTSDGTYGCRPTNKMVRTNIRSKTIVPGNTDTAIDSPSPF